VKPSDEKAFCIESNLHLASEFGAVSTEVFNVLEIEAVVNLVPGGRDRTNAHVLSHFVFFLAIETEVLRKFLELHLNTTSNHTFQNLCLVFYPLHFTQKCQPTSATTISLSRAWNFDVSSFERFSVLTS